MGLKNKIVVTLLLAVAVALTGILFIAASKNVSENEVTLNGNDLIISGKIYAVVDITTSDVELITDNLDVTMRYSGLSSSNEINGEFAIKGKEGSTLCAIKDKTKTYIQITSGEESYIVNLKTSEQTLKLYNEILAKQSIS